MHQRLIAHAISLLVLLVVLATAVIPRQVNRGSPSDQSGGKRPEQHSSGDREYWFPAKRYGWGWGLPLTWQGWVVLAVWSAVLLVVSRYLLPHSALLNLIFPLVMVLLLLGICYMKGEPARWHWGDRED